MSKLASLNQKGRRQALSIGLGLAGLVLIGAAADPDAGGNSKIPDGAKVVKVSADVVVYHWRVWNERRDGYVVYAVPEVKNWPKYKWGAEIMVSPVPLCCGAKQSAVQWRKSESTDPKLIAELDSSRNYRIYFRFK